MPEYLAPGVYVEEVSFRAKSIEGVPTSTTGFAGIARTGPVRYTDGPLATEPRLITSFPEFERVYGGLEALVVGPDATDTTERVGYLAHAARAFFENGGKRLYVSRVFRARTANDGIASRTVNFAGTSATWRARWPGAFGNVWVETRFIRSKNLAYSNADFGVIQATRAKEGAIVEITLPPAPPPPGPPPPEPPLAITDLYQVVIGPDGRQLFRNATTDFAPGPTHLIKLIELRVIVKVNGERTDVYDELGTHPRQKRYIGRIFDAEDPEDENTVVTLDWEPPSTMVDAAAQLMVALSSNASPRLEGGNDGDMPEPSDLKGEESDPDDARLKATGLEALGEVEDIAIVALPDGGTLADVERARGAADALISHAERLKYRIAIVDAPPGSSMNEIRDFRGRFDSKYAALYHPYIEVLDPLERAAQGAPPRKLLLPPSGFVAGIYARTDIERGVHKAPANEVVRGLNKFEVNINKGRQDVLNPEGINALRFFEGRGNRVWGARTMSSDPEWKYVNVRRLFIYLEHSIDKGTQWAVFEPNGPRLWANIRQTVEDFLYILWRDGALLGNKAEEAYFVRCDRTTMAQNDLDNGRLICLIGIAPVKPAEFVIFRIGQWTGDSKRN